MSRPIIGVRKGLWLGLDAVGDAREDRVWVAEAERLGFDLVFVVDRLLAAAQGRDGLPVYGATMLDPFVQLAEVAAITERVQLATFVAAVPFRHPAQLAKLTASLDVVSGGRFVFGAGSGWSVPELRLFGINGRQRGEQMEEGLQLIRRLWKGRPISHEGKYWKLDGVCVLPRPVRKDGPPIWLGSFAPDDTKTWGGEFTGAQVTALRRVGRITDGWAPLTYSAGHKKQIAAEQLGAGWHIVAEAAEANGRSSSDIDIVYSHWIAVVETAKEERECKTALSRFFPGDYAAARNTYLIGSGREVSERIADHIRRLPRVDALLFTTLVSSVDQLEKIAEILVPSVVDVVLAMGGQ